MTSRIEQYRVMQADVDRRRAGQCKAAEREWARPAPQPAPPIRAPRRTFASWFSEQMQIPESHESAWLLVFVMFTILVGLATIWRLS